MAIISNQLLQELRLILKEDYNLKLSLREVTEIATNLVGFFETLLKVEATEVQGGKQNGNDK